MIHVYGVSRICASHLDYGVFALVCPARYKARMPAAVTPARKPRPSAPAVRRIAAGAAPRVGLVSLGCPKALVDSERIVTKLRSEGYELSPDYAGADVVLENTCGFLDSAKRESLEAIGEAMAQNGRVIVTGCLGVEESRIRAALPGVLAVTGPHQYEQVVAAVHEAVPPVHDAFLDLVPPEGLRLTPRHYAYLRISEGCNQNCAFCTIPSIRGKMRSKPLDRIVAEARELIADGAFELNLIGQDTTSYGDDIGMGMLPGAGGASVGMPGMLRAVSKAFDEVGAKDGWVRLMYAYPSNFSDEMNIPPEPQAGSNTRPL